MDSEKALVAKLKPIPDTSIKQIFAIEVLPSATIVVGSAEKSFFCYSLPLGFALCIIFTDEWEGQGHPETGASVGLNLRPPLEYKLL